MEVTSSLWSIVRSLHQVAIVQRRASAEAPLGPVPLGVLNLAAQTPVRPREAAIALAVPAQSITRAVEELTAAGLVRRVGDPADGRSYAIDLTAAGRDERTGLKRTLTRQFARHLEGWSPEEITLFADQLERLVQSLVADVPADTSTATGRNPWRAEP